MTLCLDLGRSGEVVDVDWVTLVTPPHQMSTDSEHSSVVFLWSTYVVSI